MSGFDVNAVLNISKKGLSCQQVANSLQKFGIKSHVTENITIQTDSETNTSQQETGCSINLCGLDRKKYAELWSNLKNEFDLDCAHLHIDNQYTGCIYSYLQPSACPGFKKTNN